MRYRAIVAIVCISTLEVVALLNGIDGAVFGIVIAAIAGLGGYEIKTYIEKRKGG